ncbi:MAG: family 20 glycosylhydrolase [Bacteroidota bacterium]
MKYLLSFLVVSLLCLNLVSCKSDTKETPKSFTEEIVLPTTILPKPTQMKLLEGTFTFQQSTTIFAEPDFQIAVDFLRNHIQKGSGLTLSDGPKEEATVIFELDASQPSEGYALDISEEKIIIKASDSSGAFYAAQTIRQLLPVNLERINSLSGQPVSIRQVQVIDAPQFKYRGMHLDVARHFFDKEFVKEYIAHLSMLKMNYFHWHLTEDQGWRIEIKKYPRLTTHAAYRNETLIGHYNSSPQKFDGKRYGGFYTQEDIKEVVAFAAAHNVTVIPEIEMPGHAQAAISAYPELGCTGENVPVATKWGVFENIYCPNQKTFAFLEDVLTEVMDLFPGKYVHIGGDEAPKKQWKECGHCQKLIRDLNLKDENGLQSYFIKKIEAFVNSKGKKIIGWDEILEGGLAPNATVMSWRGMEGAVEAAKEGHDVILTPGSHAYFDHYQADLSDEPLAIGGFLPLKKVYSFDPIPVALTTEEAKYVLGAQGNVWTEYMPTADQVEYMAFPRILAMSEVVWRGATTNLEAEYPDFLSRVEQFMSRMDALDINYANHMYDVSGEIIKKDGKLSYQLTSSAKGKPIVYRLNDVAKDAFYNGPIPINTSMTVEAAVVLGNDEEGRAHRQTINLHNGVTAVMSLNVEPHPAYSAGGIDALNNGISGSDNRYGDKEWLGFWGEDLEIVIDLGEEKNIRKLSTRFYNANGQWIYAPKKVSVQVTLENGSIMNRKSDPILNEAGSLASVSFDLDKKVPVKTRFVTLTIPNYGMIAEGLQGAGNRAWTFIDEIIIE